MSDKFKFTPEEREEVHADISDTSKKYTAIESIIDRIEQIIQDRGNSIQDGWIGVEEQEPENKWYMVATNRPEDHPRKVIEAFYDGGDDNLWLDMNGDLPEGEEVTHYMEKPSAPKQPKK